MKKRFMIMNQVPDAGTMAGGTGGQSTGEAGTAHANVETTNTQTVDPNAAAQVDPNAATNTSDGDKFDFDSLPSSAQDYIKSLRTESAEHRTKNNNLSTRLENIEKGMKTMFGGEDQELSPEEQISQISQTNETLSYENAIMGMAYENGIPMDNYEYFNFLMDKEVNGLEEGQELSEETLMGVIGKAKGFNQSMDNTNTSVDDQGNAVKDPNNSSGMTLDQFSSMSVVEKSELYIKSPAVYEQFMKQAINKRLL